MDEKHVESDLSGSTFAPPEGETVAVQVSLVSGKSLCLSRLSSEQVGQLKQAAAEQLGLLGEEVKLVQDGTTLADTSTLAELRSTALDLVALSPGSISAVVDNRVVVASGSTLKVQAELDYSKSTRRSPYHVHWNPADVAHVALRGQNMLWIHDFSQGREIFTRPCRGLQPHFKWSPDGSRIAYVASVMQVDVLVLDPPSDFRFDQRSEATSLAWHPQNSHLAVGQHDGIAIFNMETRTEENFFPLDTHVELVDWHSGGELLASGDSTGAMRVMTLTGEVQWHLRQCDAALQMGLQDSLACIEWSPVDTSIAFCSCAGTAIQLFDAKSGKLLWKSADYCPFADLCWNYDGTKVAGACQDGHIHVLDAKTGNTFGSLELGRANSISWSKA